MDIGQVDVVQIDVTRCGGLTEGRKIAWDALDRGRSVINHSFTTDINIAASMALLATLPRAPFVEYCVEASPLRDALVRNPPALIDGHVQLPQGVGLGVEVDFDTVERYLVR
jgi:L-alanine-DL-glutamate epimerase-like enolase superfamily enzyme